MLAARCFKLYGFESLTFVVGVCFESSYDDSERVALWSGILQLLLIAVYITHIILARFL